MKHTMNMSLALVVLLLLTFAASAQKPVPASTARQRMEALGFLVGEWQGEARLQMGTAGRRVIQQHELVEWKAGGEVLLIQGHGREGALEFNAVATIAWDSDAQQYVMWTYRAGGGPGRPAIEVSANRVVWGFDGPGSSVRYTIRLDDKGRWVESGERSIDGGSTWRPFFEMVLQKR